MEQGAAFRVQGETERPRGVREAFSLKSLSIFRIPSSAGNHAKYCGLEVVANQQMLLWGSGGCLTNFEEGRVRTNVEVTEPYLGLCGTRKAFCIAVSYWQRLISGGNLRFNLRLIDSAFEDYGNPLWNQV